MMELIWEAEVGPEYKVSILTTPCIDELPILRMYLMTGEELARALEAEKDGLEIVVAINCKVITESYHSYREGSKERIEAVTEALRKASIKLGGG